MNRNNEAHFNRIPQTHISRSRFKRDQNVKFTFDAGKLIPFYVDEVLPGDTFSVDTAGLVRMTTPIFPVMDNAYLDVYYFFVPNRIVWEHWKEFMGENTTGAWEQKTEYSVPQQYLAGYTMKSGIDIEASPIGTVPEEESILDYMGIPTKCNRVTAITPEQAEKDITVNALPIRGYVKIWNEWFRDQNLTDPVKELKDDKPAVYVRLDESHEWTDTQLNLNAATGGKPLPVAKYHDYFTSALPTPQKGPSVAIGITGDARVQWAFTVDELQSYGIMTSNGESHLVPANGNTLGAPTRADTNGYPRVLLGKDSGGTSTWVPMQARLDNVEAATVNQLREAFAVQHYYEALARGGSRYREIIRSVFGTTISDKTVQIPEYLGGGRYPINMSQVVQTSSTTADSPQGNTAAISVTPFSESSFTKSFEEHGFIIGVCCVRHDHTYQQGIERMWSRQDALDYYYPQFANLGEQAVKVKEIYTGKELTKENTEEVFGYQEAWSEYRMKPNRVAGKFRSNATGTLDTWHYADNYDKRPYLSDEWIKEGKQEIQRTLAVQDEPQFIADFLIQNNTTRPMPLYSVPGLEKL
jgi:hypothetical protein